MMRGGRWPPRRPADWPTSPRTGTAQPLPAPAHDNALTGVAATSAHDAWAVGRSVTGTVHNTLILYWNGTKWARVPSPAPGSSSDLLAVAATSASNAWAVGGFTGTGPSQALALHCC